MKFIWFLKTINGWLDLVLIAVKNDYLHKNHFINSLYSKHTWCINFALINTCQGTFFHCLLFVFHKEPNLLQRGLTK